MGLKNNWIDKADNIDDVSADHINQVARAVIELEDKINSISFDDLEDVPFTSVDSEISKDSTNPVQNKAIAEKIADLEENAGASSWNDLTDKPFGESETKSISVTLEDFQPEVMFEASNIMWFKVSNETPSKSELIGGKLDLNIDGESDIFEISQENIVIDQDWGLIMVFSVGIAMFVTYKTGTFYLPGVGDSMTYEYTIPETGIYFASLTGAMPTEGTASLTWESVKKLDIKYIPDELYTAIDDRIDAYIEEALGGDY